MRVWGLGCRVWGLGCRVQGLGCRAQGLGWRVQGLGFRVQGLGPSLRRIRIKLTLSVYKVFCGLDDFFSEFPGLWGLGLEAGVRVAGFRNLAGQP